MLDNNNQINLAPKKNNLIRVISFSLAIVIFVIAAYVLILGLTVNPEKKVVDNTNTNTEIKNNKEEGPSLKMQLASQDKIKKFTDYDELKKFLSENSSENLGNYGYMGIEIQDMPMRELTSDEAVGISEQVETKSMDVPMGFGGGSEDFSATNIQVEGVDEADIIKTDGKYIYAVSGNRLFIAAAYPAEQAEILSKIEFKSQPQDIYINGDKLVVYGYNNIIYDEGFYNNFRRKSAFTFFKVFDISDRKNPKQVRDLDFEGTLVNSRMVGDYIYFITSQQAFYYEDEMPVPRILEGDTVINKDKAMDVYYIDAPYSSYNFTHIAAINIKDDNEEISSEAYLLGYGQNLYVSLDNIYITYTKYISEYQLTMEVVREFLVPRLPEKDKGKIREIEATPNYILNQEEKMRKITIIIEGYFYSLSQDERDVLTKEIEEKMKQKYQDISKELEKTIIHKIGINKSKFEYKASGAVTGNVLNQFSMDEHNGYFRIATTKNRTWSRYEEENIDSYANLYVLDENLSLIGKVENLAKGEQIYSVRFMQDRAYMVTFKQTDPLFVIDLKEPTAPTVLGELKIPGFSSYLHPYDNETLIGIGKDTTENEWGGVTTKGLKFSLFDVKDVASPKEIDTYIIGDVGSESLVLNDHKAFLFSRDKNLLVVPAIIRESKDGNSWGNVTFSGALVFGVSKDGFELNGRISHLDEKDIDIFNSGEYYYDYNMGVKRSLYIDNVLYTFSDYYLKINDLENLDLVKNLELKKEKEGDFEIIN